MQSDELNSNPIPAIAAHRGASRRYPENSLAAMKEAINIAMDHPDIRFFIEMDARKTADGALVLMHDSDVSRTTNGRGQVEDKTLAELQALQLTPMSKLVLDSERSPERSSNPLLNITQEDVKPAALHEVMAIVEVANAERLAHGGSAIGMAIEMKPAAHMHNPVGYGVKGMLSGIAGMLDRIGLGVSADIVSPTNAVAATLAQALNARAQNLPPLVVFSSQGQAGKRDLEVLWEHLDDAVKTHLGQDHFEAASPTILVDRTDAKPLSKLANEAIGHSNRFWAIGSPDVLPMVTMARPLNEPASVMDAMEQRANFITTDRPGQTIAVVKHMRDAMRDAAMPEVAHSYVSEEMQRRAATVKADSHQQAASPHM